MDQSRIYWSQWWNLEAVTQILNKCLELAACHDLCLPDLCFLSFLCLLDFFLLCLSCFAFLLWVAKIASASSMLDIPPHAARKNLKLGHPTGSKDSTNHQDNVTFMTSNDLTWKRKCKLCTTIQRQPFVV